jgi:hypothetical protein
MENEINVNMEGFTGNELVIREGSAVVIRESKIIEFTGDIKSVASFLKIRKTVHDGAGTRAGEGTQEVNTDRAVVLVDKAAMTIQLLLDPQNHYGASVVAKLEFSDELKKWCINATKTWKLNELTKHIRFNRIDFDDYEKHGMLLKSYQSFNFKAHIEVMQEADQRGNKSTSFKKTADTGLPTDFVLNIPIFKGQESQRFHVEICLETTEGAANFWFESTELHELIKTQRDIIFNEQLVACEGFVIINK